MPPAFVHNFWAFGPSGRVLFGRVLQRHERAQRVLTLDVAALGVVRVDRELLEQARARHRRQEAEFFLHDHGLDVAAHLHLVA